MSWSVKLSGKADKQQKRLTEGIRLQLAALVVDIESKGPMQPAWRNFGKLKGMQDHYHCHLKSARPTIVVCWRVTNKMFRHVEVYYAGSHEKAPY